MCRKATRVLDCMGSNELSAARRRVSSLQLSTQDLHSLLPHGVPYYEHTTSDILTLFSRILNKVISHNVDVSVSSGQLLFHLRYKDQTPLSTDDEKQVELVLETWERYVQAFCKLALAEVAWQMEPVVDNAETFEA
jgi:hypothetical protein